METKDKDGTFDSAPSKDMNLKDEVCVKEECSEDMVSCDIMELYADHMIKDELVLGPELVQPRPRVLDASSPSESLTTKPAGTTDQRTSNEAYLFECSTCGEKFNQTLSLTKHITECNYTKPKLFKCLSCGQFFDNQLDLSEHIKIQHLDPVSLTYDCSLCGNKFQKISLLSAHIKTHNRGINIGRCNKNVLCSICGKKKRRLRPKIYECDSCGLTFFNELYLSNHIEARHVTAATLTYECSICGKKFIQLSLLSRHISTHKTCRCYKAGYVS